LLMRVQI